MLEACGEHQTDPSIGFFSGGNGWGDEVNSADLTTGVLDARASTPLRPFVAKYSGDYEFNYARSWIGFEIEIPKDGRLTVSTFATLTWFYVYFTTLESVWTKGEMQLQLSGKTHGEDRKVMFDKQAYWYSSGHDQGVSVVAPLMAQIPVLGPSTMKCLISATTLATRGGGRAGAWAHLMDVHVPFITIDLHD